MPVTIEELENQSEYREILSISYDDLIPFIFSHLKSKTILIVSFWSICILTLGLALTIRFNIGGYFIQSNIILHSVLGFILFPVLCIPLHELLHMVPYFISGARDIRIGMDLKQFLFYVTAHKYVASPLQFIIVAVIPFFTITLTALFLIFVLPGVWKWSLAAFLFAHTTMCAGDFALLDFYYLHRGKKVYTWDDADKKVAYFYEKI